MRAAMVIAVLLSCSACSVMPHSIYAEYEHVSHPLAGWPVEPQAGTEDTLDHVSLLGRWDYGRAYAEAGVGYKLRDGGMHGPDMTGTVRVGIRLWERKK